jgi:hypothetical protein
MSRASGTEAESSMAAGSCELMFRLQSEEFCLCLVFHTSLPFSTIVFSFGPSLSLLENKIFLFRNDNFRFGSVFIKKIIKLKFKKKKT